MKKRNSDVSDTLAFKKMGKQEYLKLKNILPPLIDPLLKADDSAFQNLKMSTLNPRELLMNKDDINNLREEILTLKNILNEKEKDFELKSVLLNEMESELNKVRLLYEEQIVDINDSRTQLDEEKLKNEFLDRKSQDLLTTIDDLQNSLDDSSKIVINLENTLSTVKSECKSLESCLAKITEENINLTNLMNTSKKELIMNQKRIFDKNEEIERLTNDIVCLKRELLIKNEAEINSNKEKLFLQNQIKERSLETRNLQAQIASMPLKIKEIFDTLFDEQQNNLNLALLKQDQFDQKVETLLERVEIVSKLKKQIVDLSNEKKGVKSIKHENEQLIITLNEKNQTLEAKTAELMLTLKNIEGEFSDKVEELVRVKSKLQESEKKNELLTKNVENEIQSIMNSFQEKSKISEQKYLFHQQKNDYLSNQIEAFQRELEELSRKNSVNINENIKNMQKIEDLTNENNNFISELESLSQRNINLAKELQKAKEINIKLSKDLDNKENLMTNSKELEDLKRLMENYKKQLKDLKDNQNNYLIERENYEERIRILREELEIKSRYNEEFSSINISKFNTLDDYRSQTSEDVH